MISRPRHPGSDSLVIREKSSNNHYKENPFFNPRYSKQLPIEVPKSRKNISHPSLAPTTILFCDLWCPKSVPRSAKMQSWIQQACRMTSFGNEPRSRADARGRNPWDSPYPRRDLLGATGLSIIVNKSYRTHKSDAVVTLQKMTACCVSVHPHFFSTNFSLDLNIV